MEKRKSKIAEHGEKMIEVQVRFWTNKIAKGKNRILPKHCYASGVVKIQPNSAHGIHAMKKPKPFHSLMDLTSIIEKVLIENEIKIHPGRKMREYMSK